MVGTFVWVMVVQGLRQCLYRCILPEWLFLFQLPKKVEHNWHKTGVWMLHLLRHGLSLLRPPYKKTLLLLEPQVSLENMHSIFLYKQ